jgi:EAL domain-containing protein (putative c-di-GMP-specific phosphodiesterase class I)
MNEIVDDRHHIQQLKAQLQEALFLDLDEYVLEEPVDGEFTSRFLGVSLKSAFQPIYDTEAGEVLGHEAFLRGMIGSVQEVTPAFVFGFAEDSKKLVKFDRICRTLHLLNYREIFKESGALFLNVHPELLLSVNAHGKVFERILHANSVPTNRVVIEINESAILNDVKLQDAVENYRERKYQIAIDGFGRRQSNLDRLWKLAPDFVKFDMPLIHDAEQRESLRSAFPGLVRFVKDLGAKPIIQGIENQQQFDIAIASGCQLLQGYFLGKPVVARELEFPKILQTRFTP